MYKHLAPNGAGRRSQTADALCPIYICFRPLVQSPRHHPSRGFIRDDAQPVTAFTAKPVDQSPGFFVSQRTRFAAALADY